MPDKEIHVFDTSNAPLAVKGIVFELYDARSSVMLANDTTRDLSPPRGKWGVLLTFAARSGPVEVYTMDPTYRYPGNVIRHLEGTTDNEIRIDLLALPSSPGGHTAAPTSASPLAISGWIEQAPLWNRQEKEAVRNLVFNYVTVVVARNATPDGMKRSASVAKNWRTALERIGFPLGILEK